MFPSRFLTAAIGAAAILFASMPQAVAAEPRANGETLRIQTYPSATGAMHAVVAHHKGFCERYNFTCELVPLASGTLGLQALVGEAIDVAVTGSDAAASTRQAGADVVIVATSRPNTILSLAVRSDVPMPNRVKGYPDVMLDFKGLRVGVAARGTSSELYFAAMMTEAGLRPEDVTFVAVGAPATAYPALTVGKLVDVAIMYDPMSQLCNLNKDCDIAVNMTAGEGPEKLLAMNGAYVVYIMNEKKTAENPDLTSAFNAALKDAATWIRDPDNFEELVALYEPVISFGELAGSGDLLRSLLKDATQSYSADTTIKRSAVAATIDYFVEAGVIAGPVDPDKLIWAGAPVIP